MGQLTILTINRNEDAITQQYRIEYKLSTDVDWIKGPTLSYDQAQQKPAGVLPLNISLPAEWISGTINVRIVTVCISSEVNGDPIDLQITNTTPVTVYWGFAPTLEELPQTKDDIMNSPYYSNIINNAPIIANYSGASNVPMFLWFAYPDTQEIKNTWQDQVDQYNGASLGGIDDLMHAPDIIENFIFHHTGYKTYNNNPIMFTHV